MRNLAYQNDFQEDMRDEMLDGKIVVMSPRPVVKHNIVSGNIITIFNNFLRGKKCIPFSDGVDVYLTEKDRAVPDAMIVCNKDIIKSKGVYGSPDLVVEVLSPSTAKKDRGYKMNLYERCGIKEYWIVDIDNTSIEVYLLKESSFVLDEIYRIFPDHIREDMTEEELNEIKSEFSVSMFPQMIINLHEVFERII